MDAQMLDGKNNILRYVGEIGVPPTVDSVEELKVRSGTMSAEYGFTIGGRRNAPNTSFVTGSDGRNRSAMFGTITAAHDARIIHFGLKVIF